MNKSSPESPAKEQPGEVAETLRMYNVIVGRREAGETAPDIAASQMRIWAKHAAALIEKLGQRTNQLERVLELYCPNHPLLSASDLDITPPPPERP